MQRNRVAIGHRCRGSEADAHVTGLPWLQNCRSAVHLRQESESIGSILDPSTQGQRACNVLRPFLSCMLTDALIALA